ncbi:hypothetical protein BaRGS_00001482 [Batillaria attramentaria]|uniref:Uncharacterized protein n=1 Tax=Batillaria attramentaria TaxID=370345 RepID=A0ABD0M7P2_9CAEN
MQQPENQEKVALHTDHIMQDPLNQTRDLWLGNLWPHCGGAFSDLTEYGHASAVLFLEFWKLKCKLNSAEVSSRKTKPDAILAM